MAFSIGSYGGQPQDTSFGLPTDPLAQQGLAAALRAMSPTMALLQPPQQKPQQAQQGGGSPSSSSSGGTPLNQMLFGNSNAEGSSGLIGNGGFSNTVNGWMGNGYGAQSVPPAAQYGKPAAPDSGMPDVAPPAPAMAPPPALQMPTAAPAASSGGSSGGTGAMLGGSGGGSSAGGGDFLSLLMSLFV